MSANVDLGWRGTERRVPVADVTAETELLWDGIERAVLDVLRSGRFILGPNVDAFEREVAEYLGVGYAVGVSSGTDALVLALRALDIGPGDEVITTPFTFFATAEAVSRVGADPVFVDIDPGTFNIDPALIGAAISSKTKAILPVHLYGQPAAMDDIVTQAATAGVAVVEDAAQSFGAYCGGARAGCVGEIGAFSFFPSKNLGACGDGGLVTTNDGGVAELVRKLRSHGGRDKYRNEMIGYNARLDEIQAAILRIKLPHVDLANAGRRRAAERYSAGLVHVPGIVVPEATSPADHVYHQYTIRVLDDQRTALKAKLDAEGISTMIYYPVPVHRLPVYAPMRVVAPIAEKAADEVLSLPMWPTIDDGVIDRVCCSIGEAMCRP